MRAKFKRTVKRKTQTRTGGALARALGRITLRPKPTVEQRVMRAISRQTETKQVAYYSGLGLTGLYANNGYLNHNSTITNNLQDILRVIPFVYPGSADNQRIGERISPKSLIVQGSVRLSDGTINGVIAESRDDIVVVMYVLQHVTLKSYTTLQIQNNFAQLLRTSENTTTAFDGTVTASQLPVEDAYYRLLAKKKIRLRYAGAIAGLAEGTVNNGPVSVSNAHSYYADFRFNLTKFLPKTLKYPETLPAALPPDPAQNDPTNSSIFMCLGFYNMDGQPTFTDTTSQLMAVQWSSQMKYKDT